MRKKDQQQDEDAQMFAGGPSADARIMTPIDIQQKEFRVSRFGGYRMRDVDEFLDELTEAMQGLIAENERLAAGGSPGRTAGPSAPPGDPAERAALEAFLTREREFLQSLGVLVQEHLEGVRGMARSARRPAAALAPAAAVEPEVARPDPAKAASASERRPGKHAAPSHVEEADDPAPTETMRRVPEAEPVRVDSPAPAAAKGADDGDEETSLRDLFWGEED